MPRTRAIRMCMPRDIPRHLASANAHLRAVKTLIVQPGPARTSKQIVHLRTIAGSSDLHPPCLRGLMKC
jgi:hypothetical protein